jgi:predicted nuclease of predicted toxin-antitoxin system
MLRFLADESCDFAAVRALRAEGFDVLAVAETIPGAEDDQVIGYALREGRLLLTEDKDFGQLVYAAGHASCGVILIRYTAAARPTLGTRIVALIRNYGRCLSKSFVVLGPDRVRISALP